MKTLEDIESEIDLSNRRIRHLEAQREKLDEEILSLNVKLKQLAMQQERLKNMPRGENS